MAFVEFVEQWILSAASLAMMERMQDIGPCKFSSFHHSQTTSMTKLKVSVLLFISSSHRALSPQIAHTFPVGDGNGAVATLLTLLECGLNVRFVFQPCRHGAAVGPRGLCRTFRLFGCSGAPTFFAERVCAAVMSSVGPCWPPFREIFIDFLLLPVWATGPLTPQVVNTARGKQLLTRNSIMQIGKFRK